LNRESDILWGEHDFRGNHCCRVFALVICVKVLLTENPLAAKPKWLIADYRAGNATSLPETINL